MKINSIPPSELFYQNIYVKQKEAPDYSTQFSSDQVEITGDAKTFSAALREAREQMQSGNVNQGRIEEIMTQIANNTYHVPGILVAGKMLGE